MSFSPKDYRDFAHKCALAAQKARTAKMRQTLNDLAKLWMQTALEIEHSEALVDSDPPAMMMRPQRRT